MLLIVYFLEAGLVLLVAPWSTFWERNLLVETSPLVGGVMRLAAVRGAVSGIGVVNLCAGLWEAGLSLFGLVRRGASGSGAPGPEAATASTASTADGRRGEDTSAGRWDQGL